MRAKKSKIKQSRGGIVFDIFIAVFMIIFLAVTLYPVINTLALSFNDGTDAIRGEIYLWPRIWSVKNYETVFKMQTLKTGAIVTVARTVLGTLSSLAVNALLAFILSRKRFLFKKSVSLFWVITMYVNGGLIPVFLLYRDLKLTNSFWVYVVPGMVSAWNLLVMRTYMRGIPESLEESAQLDGAGYMTIFVKIISPLCKPVYATIALFIAVWQWNSWFDAMLYNRLLTKYTTLQYELMKLLNGVQKSGQNAGDMAYNVNTVTPVTVRSAASIVTMVPILCLYPFLQRYFVTGLTIGGVKE